MTVIAVPPGRPGAPLDVSLTERAPGIALRKTTEMADSTRAVPLSYYRDPALYEREPAPLKITPLAVGQNAQLTEPNASFVRTLLGSSLPATRDADGRAHVFLDYCRHRGARPAEGDGVRNGRHDHLPIGRNEIGVQHMIRTIAHALDLDSGSVGPIR